MQTIIHHKSSLTIRGGAAAGKENNNSCGIYQKYFIIRMWYAEEQFKMEGFFNGCKIPLGAPVQLIA